MKNEATRGLRRVAAVVGRLADRDPAAAKTVREEIGPDLKYVAEELEHRAQLAAIGSDGPDPEEAIDPLCRAAVDLPEHLARLSRKYERALHLRPERLPALWKRARSAH